MTTAREFTLTQDDLGTLRRAAFLRRKFDAGIFASGAGSRSHMAKLERFGLLSVVGWGRDIDGESPDDVMVYELTALAQAVLAQRDEIRAVYGAALRAFASAEAA